MTLTERRQPRGPIPCTTNFDFTISSTLQASEDFTVTVNTATVLEAAGGSDFTAVVGGTGTITAGATSGTVRVVVSGDTLVELDEQFSVNLSDAAFDGTIDATRAGFADAMGIGVGPDDRAAMTRCHRS